MTQHSELIVFSDLDGTLIDHHTYDFSPAAMALEMLDRLSAGLVLASSKTAPEIYRLRAEIGCDAWPAIVENGSGILSPFLGETPDDAQYRTIRAILDDIPTELRVLFRGFGDVSAAEIVQMTGLTLESAVLAQTRSFSEPGLWLGNTSQRNEFLAALAIHGVTAQQGGRFLTLSFGANKVDQMRKIIETYQPRYTIALGDAPNDIEMLEYADTGVIVANPTRPPIHQLSTEAAGQIIRTEEAGPLGWNLALCDLLRRFEQGQDFKNG
ncbi:MAG: HAD-IIB family hydrolase [Pseudoruegeria sp.]